MTKGEKCTEWLSALLIVAKKLLALCRMTINYRAISAATIRTTMLVLYIDVVLQNMSGTHFSQAEKSTSIYKQSSMHLEKEDLNEYRISDGVMHPVRVTQGGCTSAVSFETCDGPCSSSFARIFWQ